MDEELETPEETTTRAVLALSRVLWTAHLLARGSVPEREAVVADFRSLWNRVAGNRAPGNSSGPDLRYLFVGVLWRCLELLGEVEL